MKRTVFALALASMIAWSAPSVLGFCGFYVAKADTKLFNRGSQVVLVRDGGHGARFLIVAGLVGMVIDGLAIPVAAHLVFPKLLAGWTSFGPIGVSMALMSWCGVIGVGWVVTACASAVAWERIAPPETVVESQTAYPVPA